MQAWCARAFCAISYSAGCAGGGLVLTSISAASGSVSTYKIVNKLNDEKLKIQLSQIDWSPAFRCSDPNELTDLITSKDQLVYNSCTYKTKIYLNKKPKIVG